MTEKTVQLKVMRYKQGQSSPTYQTFPVTVNENTTVLVALTDIRRDQDSSLSLRHSCHHASCGTCGMRINGEEQLACVVKVLDLGTDTVVVEPLNNAPLLTDLVVNMEPFYDRFNTAGLPFIRESEFLPDAEVAEGIENYMRCENCIECGLCVSACPIMGSDPEYYGPAALAAVNRVVEEPRGLETESLLDWVDNQKGCWRCHVAYECSEVCPSGVDPGGHIMALRRQLTRRRFSRLLGG
ncbi:MAG: succinate dehydrogenase/fumarate reductase iron-sulfur subunit [Chloroflexota bacterium]